MLGTYFYHEILRKTVIAFGTLFNDVHIRHNDNTGKSISDMKVALAYGPMQKFLARLEQQPDLNRATQITLPRMSFEITAMQFDAIRQLPKINHFHKNTDDENKRTKLYTSTPYNVTFQLSVYAKSQDDALQIVEQIVPFFNPQYTVTVKPFADQLDIKEDVPITLEAVTFSDTYENSFDQRRTIVYDLTFDMKINFYGPQNDYGIIRNVNNNLFIMGEDSDKFIHNLNVKPDPIDVDPDSDYGFSLSYLDSAGGPDIY